MACVLDIKQNESLFITEVQGDHSIQSRLASLGFVPNTLVSLVAKMPFNGPLALQCGSSRVVIRAKDAQYIMGSMA